MSNYTPGPWKAETEYECAVYAHNNQMKIADIRGYGYLTGKGLGGIGLPDEEAKKIQDANARLIAAAPEMKDRLKEAKECLIYLTPWWEDDLERIEGVIDSINALLRRIEGDEEAK